jgi:hypothetical protein
MKVQKQYIEITGFCDVMPHGLTDCFRGTNYLHIQGRRISQAGKNGMNRGYWSLRTRGSLSLYLYHFLPCLAYSSTLKMKASDSSKTTVTIYQTTEQYISEDSNLQPLP